MCDRSPAGMPVGPYFVVSSDATRTSYVAVGGGTPRACPQNVIFLADRSPKNAKAGSHDSLEPFLLEPSYESRPSSRGHSKMLD